MLNEYEYIIYSRRTNKCLWEREMGALCLAYALWHARTLAERQDREVAVVCVPWAEVGWGKRLVLPGERIDLVTGTAV